MREFLRFTVYLPMSLGTLIWDRLTRDHIDRIIAEHHARRRRLSEGT